MKKWIIAICAACAVVLVLIVSAKPEPPVDPDDIKPNEVYSHELGVGIRLGMGKYRVDRLLGEGAKIDEQKRNSSMPYYYSAYAYCNGSLIAGYSNAVLYYISICDDTFFTYDGITIGSDIVPDGYSFSQINRENRYGITDYYSYLFDSSHRHLSLTEGSESYSIVIFFLNGVADAIELHKADYLITHEPADAVPLW